MFVCGIVCSCKQDIKELSPLPASQDNSVAEKLCQSKKSLGHITRLAQESSSKIMVALRARLLSVSRQVGGLYFFPESL